MNFHLFDAYKTVILMLTTFRRKKARCNHVLGSNLAQLDDSADSFFAKWIGTVKILWNI